MILVLKLFDTFLFTRRFYHEPFSAILINDNDEEISKPLFDFDLDNLSLADFSLLTDTGLDIEGVIKNKKNIVDFSEEGSND